MGNKFIGLETEEAFCFHLFYSGCLSTRLYVYKMYYIFPYIIYIYIYIYFDKLKYI